MRTQSAGKSSSPRSLKGGHEARRVEHLQEVEILAQVVGMPHHDLPRDAIDGGRR